MVNFLTNSIIATDFLSGDLGFTYNNSPKLKSLTGGFLSIIIILIGAVVFGYFSLELLEKRVPSTRVSQELKPKAEINLLDFPISINILGSDATPLKDAYLYLTIYAKLFTLEGNQTSYRTVFFEKCDPNIHFINNKELYYNATPYGTEMCLNPTKSVKQIEYEKEGDYVNNSDDLSFYNEYGSENSTFLNIIFYKCDEQLHNKKCGRRENAGSYLKNFYVTLYMVDYFINLQDYINPVKKRIFSDNQMVSYSQPKRNFYRWRKVSINTDDGFLMENNNEEKFFQFDNAKLDYYDSIYSVYQTTFEVLRVNDSFYRNYEKIQDVLAKAGGIFKVLSIIGNVIISYYSKYKFYFEVTNKLFKQPITTSDNISPINNKSSQNAINIHKQILIPPKIINNAYNNNLNLISSINKNALSNYSPKNVSKQNELNFKDYLKSKICSKRANYSSDIYSLSETIIKNNLDILTYLKNLRNIDQLIDLVTLNKEEKKIFDCKMDLDKKYFKIIEVNSEMENRDEIFNMIKINLRK